ncbi:type I-C CRISPR-associated protein Cas7/Csd2 [Myxococcus sp. MISCRS1]|uniref:type I-C CRISPR-associated protein Cas7/Csd2 n=1 Tax=Myxococcus TaxID=32 RepID=UPI001CBF1104|nr:MULTISPECIES: type I-C CRISPR-associated protein Cas7/Csd2 [unclassified Myxococcus]MBZ4398566.1 type I-C CRISPR-associated protein Cas7/Csd2 [Myxococcus sp. AS-1-15]MBZ4413540.1 type I-C CRISPR-associated protein Cas7/Csd2 [Myxococcus sp. XM-1-1-1]MCY1000241.1 type I-C CRISPR-associated protein Cas7/Csd2 [Myxococcus sp. MISCRS1]BDT38220.1 type I-C CRISPR-associated protein Cas7/Csd2 [Myxococcus sp. MH1]
MSELKNRHDFVLLFDVQDGNPNGDPDAGNLPRIDPETGDGLVTDVSLKRKVRNFILLTQEKKPGFDIFVKEKAVLNSTIAQAYKDLGVDLNEKPKSDKDGKKRNTKGEAQGSEVDQGRAWMCKTFFDVRTFGAVMSTGANAGQVRGPVQLTFARSVTPIVSLEHSITRMAVATEAEAEKQGGDNRTMGRKNTVPYGLYRAHGFVSPHLAKQTGFSSGDLDLLFKAFLNMFELDRSAARGLMSMRKVIVFKHGSELGNAPAHALFDRVQVTPVNGEKPARSFKDYTVKVDTAKLPQGIEVMELAG